MRTLTLATRRLVAAAILAALPLATGALRADPIPSADAAATRSAAGHAPSPQWSYAVGEGLEGPLLLGCPSAGWSCVLHML